MQKQKLQLKVRKKEIEKEENKFYFLTDIKDN